MIYGYARVSTVGQVKGNSLEDQERQLREAGAVKIYKDSYTGTKIDRPSLSKLLAVMETGDTFMVTKLDRIARSVKEGIEFFDSLIERGIKVNVLNIGVMDDSPTGRLIRNVFLSFAEFERDNIMERMNEGKAIARANNPEWREGRKPIDVDEEVFQKFREKQKRNEITVAECCRELGIGRLTWYNLCRKAG